MNWPGCSIRDVRLKTSNVKTAHDLDEAPQSAPIIEQIAGGDKQTSTDSCRQNRTGG